jgi:predicted enzyme involved in methoxymalonyl-ACP biosynthesis
MLRFLVETSRVEGAEFLQGWFIPTGKNAPVLQLYSSHQFEVVDIQGATTLWSLNLDEAEIAQPEWIRLCPPSSSWGAEQARA